MEITFNNTSLKVDDRLILDKVNLKIHKGEKISFVGNSYSFINYILLLINGTINPMNGEVLIGDYLNNKSKNKSINKLT